MLHDKLFPQFSCDRWHRVCLDSLIEISSLQDGFLAKSPFLDPEYFENVMNCLKRIFDFDYTYGGYLENRSRLWAGSYLKPGGTIHLGVDYNVPAESTVHSPLDAVVIDSLADTDQNGGWGGRLTLRASNEKIFVLGHLKGSQLPSIGQFFKAADIIGLVGESNENGGWFPHLHVQMISKNVLDHGLEKIDGYSEMYENLEEDYPDPEKSLSE